MSKPDLAFIIVELSYATIALVAARVFWYDLRWLSYLWLTVVPLPFLMLHLGLVK